ncbi:hypothetical protein [Streptomyces sporangiiformans]|uniref:WxL domain-containing protein n=1 Tax=Streptomyces sporangiiformans TaxID=2315329 RepID=A0A505DII7_9ACTN|nr:hypothetical protein [Streptomyces sporangiiformans]TPQ17979.1 hypothetical protein FGD71_033760 [Streptomyces sporangiiformans]
MDSRFKQLGRVTSRVGLSVVAVAALGVVTAAPASAADTGATFTVTGDVLGITAPASAPLGSGAPGTDIAPAAGIGTVTVVDGRAVQPAVWTATVTATAFTTPGGGASRTIANSNVDYWSGTCTGTGGDGGGATPVWTGGQADAGAAVDLSTSRTACSLTGGAGINNASWDPHLIVHVPGNIVAGAYSGTVTHSVAGA